MDSNSNLEDYLKLGEEIISVKQGYHAMLKFLNHYYRITDSSDLTDILSGGALLDDGFPLDKAFWYYWVEAIAEINKRS